MATLIHTQYQQPLVSSLSSSPKFTTKISPRNSNLFINSSKTHVKHSINYKTQFPKSPPFIAFALTESDSPKSLNSDPQFLLQQLGDNFDLPSDYFEKLPKDLRLDLNDAAFDLSNGPVLVECGQELGETLLELSRAWQLADTSTSASLAKKLPSFAESLRESGKSGKTQLQINGSCVLNYTSSYYTYHVDYITLYFCAALGKRLVSAGRRFQSMGQYGQGELQRNLSDEMEGVELFARVSNVTMSGVIRSSVECDDGVLCNIANSMIDVGKLLSASVPEATEEPTNVETRMFKFGELQVELTPEKAYIGAVIAVVFGVLSWQVSQGIQNIPESSLQYPNENALLLVKSMRGALLALFYSSTLLSGFSTIGLVLLAGQLKSKDK